jgi:Zn finger protein HypA/HybF involved in hydrogenase expression
MENKYFKIEKRRIQRCPKCDRIYSINYKGEYCPHCLSLSNSLDLDEYNGSWEEFIHDDDILEEDDFLVEDTIDIYWFKCSKCSKEFWSEDDDPDNCFHCHSSEFLEPLTEEDFDTCLCCGEKIIKSSYLKSTIPNEKTRFFANQITHYRHSHRAWDKNLDYISNHCDYDKQKEIINNQIKRVLIKKHYKTLVTRNFVKEDLLQLQHNDDKTVEMINILFNN